MAEQPDLAGVLATIREGDPSAMQALYERYAAQLYHVCLVRLGDGDAAQEVVQQVFIHVWQRLPTFDERGEAALIAWLHTIAYHAVVTRIRKRKRQLSVARGADVTVAQRPGTDPAGTVSERLTVRQALARLSPAQQQVIALRYLAGLSTAQTARVLDRTEGAVKALHQRALVRLHAILTAEHGPAEGAPPQP